MKGKLLTSAVIQNSEENNGLGNCLQQADQVPGTLGWSHDV